MTSNVAALVFQLQSLTDSNAHNHARLELGRAMVESPADFGLTAEDLEVAQAAVDTLTANLAACEQAGYTPWENIEIRAETLAKLECLIQDEALRNTIHMCF